MRYAIFSDVHGNLPAVEHVRVEYDVERAARGIEESGLPDAFADHLRRGST